ncbi:FK506-binding protein 2A [Modicella reniformis]|uniref:peptidylprolyl isomerase n=1 Tax=Modicella reniformis TaxID=1440133 RepID=A0A9P6SLB1_9FUNG|nr:FK506-binding protein 2A [Modicella reniformis]
MHFTLAALAALFLATGIAAGKTEPIQLQIGWDRGLRGMCVGEKRKLSIPSKLAYGERSMGASIPANSALVFDVELLEINGHGKDEL